MMGRLVFLLSTLGIFGVSVAGVLLCLSDPFGVNYLGAAFYFVFGSAGVLAGSLCVAVSDF